MNLLLTILVGGGTALTGDKRRGKKLEKIRELLKKGELDKALREADKLAWYRLRHLWASLAFRNKSVIRRVKPV